MKKILFLALFAALMSHCSSSPQKEATDALFVKNNPVVTIETSGDFYHEPNGQNVQMDFFGNCSPGQSLIYIEVDKKKSATQCEGGRYRYSMNLPNSFFEQTTKNGRTPSSNYAMKEIYAYHDKHKKLSATSFILIDKKNREVKSVINKQVKFEKIPTGDYEPLTQYNSFGTCSMGSIINVEITSPDRYGHETSKFDDKKECQASVGYYFLSQVHGYPKKGTKFKVHEDIPDSKKSDRNPASNAKVKYKNLFNWNVAIDTKD